MSQDKEREIQLQFLEEASEYLDTIESALLGLTGSYIDAQKMDAVLRAAHSVKGGAGMMGYGTLSQLAHRLEDSFKVLKQQRSTILVDESLESLLLSGVDRLRQVLSSNRLGTDVDEQWVNSVGNPVFEQLHERLGDPGSDDATTMLGGEDGTNVAALLFETEVDGCLNRLEAVLADPQAPCLMEELSIMAQELGGLGEMLQLEAFTQLCESVLQQLETAPSQLFETAQSALKAWRRSQALVLVGQVSSLPNSIDTGNAVQISPTQRAHGASAIHVEEENWQAEIAAEFDDLPVDSSPTLFGVTSTSDESHLTSEVVILETSTEQEQSGQIAHPTHHYSEAEPLYGVEENAENEVVAAHLDIKTPDELPRRLEASTHESPASREAISQASAGQNVQVKPSESEVHSSDVTWRDVKNESHRHTKTTESQENSVRIPVRQLDRLNDLFGELTIERNGLSLQLGRLRNLIETLSRRVSTLEQSNKSIRSAYDKVATQATGSAVAHDYIRFNAPDAHVSSQQLSLNTYFNAAGATTRTHGHSHGLGESVELLPRADRVPELGRLKSEFDALEMDRYSDLHLLSSEVMETIVQIQEVTSDIGLAIEDTDSVARELNQTAKQLQTNLTRVRMRPFHELVGRFSRALRDLSFQYGKLVELKVSGKGTLIDRSILEALSDPLLHLVRNAFDHGIEDPATRSSQGKPAQGVIEIKAAHRGNQTIITISDDGNGINLNKIRARAEAMGLDAELLAAASEGELLSLIFEPGFSTADKVTDLSGRGVGMDVVRNNLKLIRGDIRVDTAPGRGTTFTLTVPFTLSVARVLLVESNGMLLAFPTDVIEEMLLLEPLAVLTTPGSEVLKWEEEMVPLTRLGTLLTFHCPRRVQGLEGVPSINQPTVLMVTLPPDAHTQATRGDALHGIQVDRCWGEREVAIRQVEGPLAMPPGMVSSCVLGDGTVVPLVDASELLRSYESSERRRNSYQSNSMTALPPLQEGLPTQQSCSVSSFDHSSMSAGLTPPLYASQKDTILVVDDSINVRRFLALALEKAGYLVEQAKDGQDAVEKLLGGAEVSAVICDIEMPRLDGYGFLARIKSDPNYERLPIAMLTSRSGEKHRQLAMTLGAAAYFSKPYNERELLTTMKQLITEDRAKKPIHVGVR